MKEGVSRQQQQQQQKKSSKGYSCHIIGASSYLWRTNLLIKRRGRRGVRLSWYQLHCDIRKAQGQQFPLCVERENWTTRVVRYLKQHGGIVETEELTHFDVNKEPEKTLTTQEVREQMKALLRENKRATTLRAATPPSPATRKREAAATTRDCSLAKRSPKPAKKENKLPVKSMPPQAQAARAIEDKAAATAATPNNILNILCKKAKLEELAGKSCAELCRTGPLVPAVEASILNQQHNCETSGGSEDFLGFDESVQHQAGTMHTPIVPASAQTANGNGVFFSESCDKLLNSMRKSIAESPQVLVPCKRPLDAFLDGLITADCEPPAMQRPAVPAELANCTTVLDQRRYLQSLKPHDRTLVAYNEKRIYCDLEQRRRKGNLSNLPAFCCSAQLEKPGYPITRNAWRVASYVSTPIGRYYYQVMRCDGELLTLQGTLGNNCEREKPAYYSVCTKQLTCNGDCYGMQFLRQITVIHTKPPIDKQLLSPHTLGSSTHGEDDDRRMLLHPYNKQLIPVPTVALNVRTQVNQPLQCVAQRYLTQIAPHTKISSEWAAFSVSTCVASVKQCSGMSSHTFAIPFEGAQTHMTIYRNEKRDEPLDDSFKRIIASDDLAPIYELTFRNQLDEDDAVAHECADMLAEMFNAVAVSCAEQSFYSIDPHRIAACAEPALSDTNRAKPTDRAKKPKAAAPKRSVLDKNRRLQSELKRLNATFIDAVSDSETKDADPCTNEHCLLGCVCRSNQVVRDLHEHCRKTKCMFSCTCIIPPKARITRLDNEGIGISNEDAYLLRKQATARLAPVEKEFTATVVRTKSETLLINDGRRDKSRRATKAPKRYEGSITDMSELTSPAKRSVGDEIAAVLSPVPEKMCKVRDVELARLQFISIRLQPLRNMENVSDYCMAHDLYKCHCKGSATEGKPVCIEKESSPALKTMCSQSSVYYFDKNDHNSRPMPNATRNKRQAIVKEAAPVARHHNNLAKQPRIEQRNSNNNNNNLNPKIVEITKPVGQTRRQTTKEDIVELFQKRSSDIPRRLMVVPVAAIRAVNIELLEQRQKQIGIIDPENSLQDLKALLRQNNPQIASQNPKAATVTARTEVIELDDSDTDVDADVDAEAAATAAAGGAGNNTTIQSTVIAEKLLPPEPMPPLVLMKPQRQTAATPASIVVIDDVDEPVIVNVQSHKTTQIQPGQQPLKRKINAELNLESPSKPIKRQRLSVSSGTIASEQSSIQVDFSASVAGSLIRDATWSAQDYRLFHQIQQKKLAEMNEKTSRKVEEFSKLLCKRYQLLPMPTVDTLCVMRWPDFVALYNKAAIYVWQMQSPSTNFFAATLTSSAPLMPNSGRFVARNIVTLAGEKYPLAKFANLLLHQRRSSNFLNKLSVLMAGGKDHWRVLGFLRQELDRMCTKTTPESNPKLSAKVRKLCEDVTLNYFNALHKDKQEAATQVEAAPDVSQVQQQQQQQQQQCIQMDKLPTVNNEEANKQQERELLRKRKQPHNKPPQPVPGPDNLPDQNLNIVQRNVEMRAMMQSDAIECHLPPMSKPGVLRDRWYVLDMRKDFSHLMLHTNTLQLIERNVIEKAFSIASARNEFQQLDLRPIGEFMGFVSPRSQRLLYLGPFEIYAQQPWVVLLQSVDNRLMTREFYQQAHGIPVDIAERSTAFWVYAPTRRLRDVDRARYNAMISEIAVDCSGSDEDDDDDEDDCVIIETDSDESEEQADEECDNELAVEQQLSQTIARKRTANGTLKPLVLPHPVSNSLLKPIAVAQATPSNIRTSVPTIAVQAWNSKPRAPGNNVSRNGCINNSKIAPQPFIGSAPVGRPVNNHQQNAARAKVSSVVELSPEQLGFNQDSGVSSTIEELVEQQHAESVEPMSKRSAQHDDGCVIHNDDANHDDNVMEVIEEPSMHIDEEEEEQEQEQNENGNVYQSTEQLLQDLRFDD